MILSMKMKIIIIAIAIALLLFSFGCGEAETVPAPREADSNTSAGSTKVELPANGNYPGKGVVTKINDANGSIELDHEKIDGVMPAMKMEFNVRDKSQMNGLKVGDKVDFTLEYKDRHEIITEIKKAG
jgi:Cu/Ag efflux protein CusF